MEQLGLGVRLELDDDMSREINPIIRDLERLRRQAQGTTRTFNDMRNAHNPFGRNKRQDVHDYYASMQSTDRALISVSDRLILATKSANSLSKAMNRAQFSGNFNMMYRDITRVQTMLGHMGYGMSKMQREMSNLRAYNIMDVQIKDLHDRIKLTTQALNEMQRSPDASKMVKEINVAKRSLQAYQNELKRVGDLQNKLAETHGLGTMKSFTGAKDILYEDEKGVGKNIQNRMMGLANTDLALASSIMTNSLTATEKALVGTGYTALETKKKITELTGAMTGLGMALTTTVSLVSALALGGWGYLAGGNERANAQFTGQTLNPIGESSPYQASMRNVYQTSTDSDRDSISRMYASMSNSGMNLNIGDMQMLSGGANEISAGWGGELENIEILNSAMTIAKETGHSYAETLDLLSLGLKQTDGDLEGATEAVLTNAGAFKDANGKWKEAFETLEQGNKDGSINSLIQAGKGLSNVLVVLWDKSMKPVVKGLSDMINHLTLATDEFLEAHPAVAKFAGSMMGLALAVGLVAGPIILVSAFMVKFRSVIQGVGLAIQALTATGGVAKLGAQATALSHRVRGATVALARFPQTLLFGVIPALYSAIRMIPNFILNMARINPVMAGLTVGMIAYSKNWLGFGDTIKGVIEKVKTSFDNAKDIFNTALGAEVDFSQYSNFEVALSKVIGTAKVAKDVIRSIFTGEELKFDKAETRLIENLGIEDVVNTVAKVGRAVKDFTVGFGAGIELVYDKAKTFIGWMVDTFEPVIVRIANFVSKLFGGSGDASSIEDIMNSANGLNGTMKNLGLMAGVALTSLLGFKLLKPLFSGIWGAIAKTPFAGMIKSIGLLKGAMQGLGTTARNVGRSVSTSTGNVVNRVTGRVTPTPVPPVVGNTTVLRNRDGSASTVLRRNSPRPLNAVEQRRADILSTNRNARARGYDMDNQTAIRRNQPGALRDSMRVNRDGTYSNANNARLNGQQVHARRQGAMSRALFGQAYDVYGQDGRRTTINRQGGLLRRQSADNQIGERMNLRDRASLVGQSARTRVTNMGQSAMNSVRSAGSSMMNTPGAQRVASATRTAMKPITVPIKYVNSKIIKPVIKPIKSTVQWISGRLQTAGVIRQGNNAGRQSGSRFKRAFDAATRGIGAGGRMFSGAVRGAGSAGRRAGNGMLKGMNFVSKGIGGIFNAGLKAIPILGWALMAWDVVSAIFKNWDSIKSGAQTAWEWIKTSGVSALQSAWESIKGFAKSAWEWIKSDGLATATNLATSFISFLGTAWTTILSLAGQALSWILTDGIAKAVELGGQFIQWVAHDAFPKIVSFVVEQLTSLISTAGSIASSMGSAMWDAITSALSGLAGWIGEQLSGAVNFVAGLFGGGGGGGKKPKEHARGGIINAPHLGIVGEAGPEVIIPLSGNQRDRAKMLLGHTAGVLGLTVDEGKKSYDTKDFEDVPTRINTTPQNVVRTKSQPPKGQESNGVSDNSITINNVHVNLPQGATSDVASGRAIATSLAKELQKLMKQERMRSNGKNLTLEDLILNM